MSNVNEIANKIIPFANKFANLKPIKAIKDGIMITVPLTIIGSIFLLLADMPISGWANFMANIFGSKWNEPLYQISGSTFDILALVAVFGIAHRYAKNEKVEPLTAGILGIVSFLILNNSFVTSESGEIINGVIPKAWTGGKGMILAILVGIMVGFIYSWFMKKGIKIKMPDSVPEAVTSSFEPIIAGIGIVTISGVLLILSQKFFDKSVAELIYQTLQTPLQSLTDTLPGTIMVIFLMDILWWFGIHGAAVVNSIMFPIYLANCMDNQAILDAGQALVAGENAKIMTVQLMDMTKFGGNGAVLALIIAMFLFSKSVRSKQMGKIALAPALFNISEPVMFGIPIIFNPIMLIPFILVPIINVFIIYFATILDFIPIFGAVIPPWTTPPIIHGFLIGGWRPAVLQAVMLVINVVLWYPFMKMQDNLNLKEE